MISGKDNKNNRVDSNNYLDTKNKKWFRTSGKKIDDYSNYRQDHKTKYLNKFTSILPPATDTNPLFEINQAERNIIKKHGPANKEILEKTNSNNIDNNKIEIAKNITLIPSPTNLEPPKTKTRQKQNSSDISIHAYKKSSYERKIDSLGSNNTNILNMKNKINSINTIVLQMQRDSKSGLAPERKEITNSKIVQEKEKYLPNRKQNYQIKISSSVQK